jgi:antitoxin VapB
VALNIKNDEAERRARELAAVTGESLTTAVTLALEERLARVVASRPSAERRARLIVDLGREIALRLRVDVALQDHADLYDERGLPA